MPVCTVVLSKLLPQGAVDDMMHYCTRQKESTQKVFSLSVIFTFRVIDQFLSDSAAPLQENLSDGMRGNFLTSYLYHKSRNT